MSVPKMVKKMTMVRLHFAEKLGDALRCGTVVDFFGCGCGQGLAVGGSGGKLFAPLIVELVVIGTEIFQRVVGIVVETQVELETFSGIVRHRIPPPCIVSKYASHATRVACCALNPTPEVRSFANDTAR